MTTTAFALNWSNDSAIEARKAMKMVTEYGCLNGANTSNYLDWGNWFVQKNNTTFAVNLYDRYRK